MTYPLVSALSAYPEQAQGAGSCRAFAALTCIMEVGIMFGWLSLIFTSVNSQDSGAISATMLDKSRCATDVPGEGCENSTMWGLWTLASKTNARESSIMYNATYMYHASGTRVAVMDPPASTESLPSYSTLISSQFMPLQFPVKDSKVEANIYAQAMEEVKSKSINYLRGNLALEDDQELGHVDQTLINKQHDRAIAFNAWLTRNGLQCQPASNPCSQINNQATISLNTKAITAAKQVAGPVHEAHVTVCVIVSVNQTWVKNHDQSLQHEDSEIQWHGNWPPEVATEVMTLGDFYQAHQALPHTSVYLDNIPKQHAKIKGKHICLELWINKESWEAQVDLDLGLQKGKVKKELPWEIVTVPNVGTMPNGRVPSWNQKIMFNYSLPNVWWFNKLAK
ncbi:hypothetical protein JB92DRAFT_2824584 [Gautieria morchelliformis]|nr:hypothetical protein JB92DRAFT_2824584 [Gautieria morchelliformis]